MMIMIMIIIIIIIIISNNVVCAYRHQLSEQLRNISTCLVGISAKDFIFCPVVMTTR